MMNIFTIKKLMKSNRKMIGSGQQAEVFVFDDMPEIVIKIARKSGKSSDRIENEFNVRNQIIRRQPRYNILRIISHFQMFYVDDKCHIIMERICSPDENPNIVFAQLSRENNLEELNKGGVKYLEKFFNVEEYAIELGHFIGFLHYCIQLTGCDLEFVVSRPYNKKKGKYKIYILDFGLVMKTDDNNMKEKERLKLYAHAISSDTYPNVFNKNRRLYEIFVNSYISIAQSYNMREFAEKVLIKSVDISVKKRCCKNNK